MKVGTSDDHSEALLRTAGDNAKVVGVHFTTKFKSASFANAHDCAISNVGMMHFLALAKVCARTALSCNSFVTVTKVACPHHFNSTFKKKVTTARLYKSDVDAEPVHRYRRDGYHPIHLGDVLNDGRYKITHKLGWGGYSTVWAARHLQ